MKISCSFFNALLEVQLSSVLLSSSVLSKSPNEEVDWCLGYCVCLCAWAVKKNKPLPQNIIFYDNISSECLTIKAYMTGQVHLAHWYQLVLNNNISQGLTVRNVMCQAFTIQLVNPNVKFYKNTSVLYLEFSIEMC